MMIAVDHPVVFNSLVSAALRDLLGFVLWGSFVASLVLALVAIRLWSYWLLLLAAILALVFTVPASLSFGAWILMLPVFLTVMTVIVAGSLPMWSWPIVGILGMAGWFIIVGAVGLEMMEP